MSDQPYEVGYRRPPRHTRFQKGRSGNPAGRPKGSREVQSEVAAELLSTITLKENGRPIKVTKLKALLKALYARAIGGDAKAMAILIDLLTRQGLLDPPAAQNDNVEEDPDDDDDLLAAYIRRKSGGGRDA